MSQLALQLNTALLPTKARDDFQFWRQHLEPVLDRKRGVVQALAEVAQQTCVPFETVKRKFYAARKGGLLALIDRRLAGPEWWAARNQVEISREDQELVKLYCGRFQRSTEAALKQLRLDFVRGKVKTKTPTDPSTRMPRGWSVRNLRRYAPTKFELKAVRIGRSAAASERQLVYTTRQGLWVGSHYQFDDMWHDFFVNSFAEKQAGRPLELFSHDLYSARKVRWGVRVRTRKDDGTLNGLNERMTRYILAATLYLDGYSPRGTKIVAEHGTAAVRGTTEKKLGAIIRTGLDRELFDISGGLITLERGGMQGATAHAGQYGGIDRGNPRVKASLESGNNLTHNVFADAPGQTGKDREHRPEQLGKLLRHNENLLAARDQLIRDGKSERADEIQFLLLELNQFMQFAVERYAQIENDPDHELEGWVNCGHVVNELMLGGQWIDQAQIMRDPAQSALALALINAGQLATRPRKMTRREVWDAGARDLIRIPGYGVCAILGDDLASERKVRKAMFEFEDAEVGPGVHRFAAICRTIHGEIVRLSEGEKYETFVNPFAPGTLFVRRADGSYLGEAERVQAPCRGDVEAVQRAMGAAAAEEAALLAPIRKRHLGEAREKLARHEHNARVLGGSPITLAERERGIEQADPSSAARAETDRALERLASQPAPAPADDDWA